MSNTSTNTGEKVRYSKVLSSLLCFSSVVVLSILCLLNNLSLDLYSSLMLLKTVVPGAFCFWMLGYFTGQIFDKGDSQKNVAKNYKLSEDNIAYTMPSMFTTDSTDIETDEDGEL